jgi:type 1 glutamine amidotransferase
MTQSKFALVAIATLLFASHVVGAEPVKKKLLLLGQKPDGHPPGTHEYLPGLRVLAKCLANVPGIEATVVQADGNWPEGPELLKTADGVVMFLSEGAAWIQTDSTRLAAFQALAARGGGCSVIHWGMGTKEARNIEAFVKIFGGCHGGPDRRYKVVEADVRLPNARHPIASGIEPLSLKEEFYYQLKFAPLAKGIEPIVQVTIDDAPQTVSWAWDRPDGGRSFGFSGLHFHDNWQHVQYRRLLAQGALWTLRLPIPEQGLDVKIRDE